MRPRRRELGRQPVGCFLLFFLWVVVAAARTTLGAVRAGSVHAWWSAAGGFDRTLVTAVGASIAVFLLIALLSGLHAAWWWLKPPRGVAVYESASGNALADLRGPRGDCWIDSIGFSGDGHHVLGLDVRQRVHVWRMPDGERAGVLRGPWSLGAEIHTLPDAMHFVCGGGAKGVHLHRLPDGGHITTLRPPDEWVSTLAVSRDGRLLAVAVYEKGIEIRSLPDGQLVRRIASNGRCETIALSFDGRVLLGTSGSDICAWSAHDGILLRSWPYGEHPPRALAISPDGLRCAIAGYKQPTRILDVRTGDNLVEVVLPGGGSGGALAFSTDGRRLAVSSWASLIAIVDAATGNTTVTVPGSNIGGVIAWSLDDRMLVAMISKRRPSPTVQAK